MKRQCGKGKKVKKSWGHRVTPVREILRKLKTNPPREAGTPGRTRL